MSWLRVHAFTVAPLALAAGMLLSLRDLEARPWATVAVLAIFGAAFAGVAARLGGSTPPTSAILLVAALLRLILLPLPPTLSDDIYRYLWDGRVAAAGRNPYFHPPQDPSLADLRDPLWNRVAHREVETVYPPLALAAFSIAARLPRPLLAWKAMLVAIDLLSCALLLRLARARAVPAGRCLAYAWNPLVVLEVAGMGHVDALGILPLLVGALLLVEPWGDRRATTGRPSTSPIAAASGAGDAAIARQRSAAAGAALALAILTKVVPVLLLPAWTRAASRRVLYLVACLALVATAAAPFAIDAPSAPPGLVTYAVSWEWNGPIFEPLWRSLDWVGVAPWIKEGLDALKQASGRHDLWNRVYPYVYPQLLAKLLLAFGLGTCVVASLRQTDPIRAAHLLFGSVLILSATVYPWYALWVLPWAAILWRVPWLILSLTLLASYLPRLLDVPLLPWPFLLVWIPPLLAWLLTRRASRRRKTHPAARPTA